MREVAGASLPCLAAPGPPGGRARPCPPCSRCVHHPWSELKPGATPAPPRQAVVTAGPPPRCCGRCPRVLRPCRSGLATPCRSAHGAARSLLASLSAQKHHAAANRPNTRPGRRTSRTWLRSHAHPPPPAPPLTRPPVRPNRATSGPTRPRTALRPDRPTPPPPVSTARVHRRV